MSSGAYEDDGDAVIEMDLLPPRWLDVQDEITEQLAEIAKQMRKLDQLHQKHVLPGFDDEDVKKKEEREIEQLTQEITRGFQKCQQAIKRIETMVREAKQQGNINQGEEVMAQNLKISLATRVGEISAMFRKKQSAYLKSEYTLRITTWWCGSYVQNFETLVALPRRFDRQHLSRILTMILRCKNQTQTDPLPNRRPSKPSSSDCDMTPTKQLLRSANAKLRTLRKVSLSLQTSFRSCRPWSSIKGACSTASTTT